jgi:hypothetical protein
VVDVPNFPETRPARVLLCTSGGLYGALVMRRLLDNPAIELVGLVRSTRVLAAGQGWLPGVRALLRRSGPRYLAYLGIATTVADALGHWSPLAAVGRAAARPGLPLLSTGDLNAGAGPAFITRQRPDILLSAFFNQRIGEAVCAIPRHGAVNIHPSLLPDFRGVDPVFHARLQGAATLGVSLHRISPEFDAGSLLAQSAVAPDPEASLLRMTAELFDRGAALLADSLPALLQGDPGRPQPPGGGYDSWPAPAQVDDYLRAGHRLLRPGDLRLLWSGDLAD